MHDAIERGVIFDVGHGAGSFSWDVAESALAQGILPTTISSDLHVYNVDGPVFDLVTTATKFLHLGLPLEDVIAKITAVPAQVIQYGDRIGTLAVGAWGDATLLALEDGDFPLTDSRGVVRTGRQRFTPVGVVRGGAVYHPRPPRHTVTGTNPLRSHLFAYVDCHTSRRLVKSSRPNPIRHPRPGRTQGR